MLAVLEGLDHFIEHGISFLFLPTEFQALSFTSPQMRSILTHHSRAISSFYCFTALTHWIRQELPKTKCPHQITDAGI
jgi:hypothetical protein